MGVRWSRMSWSERNELWKRWRCGETVSEIAHGLRRASSVVYATVAAEGGIAPRPRQRSRGALTVTEREEISRQLAQGRSLRAISRRLRRAPSTISREVARNGGRRAESASRRMICTPASRGTSSMFIGVQNCQPPVLRTARLPLTSSPSISSVRLPKPGTVAT